MKLGDDRGEILLGLAVYIGVLIPAILLSSAVNVGDSAASHLVLYGAAVAAATAIWRQFVKPVLKAVRVILGLDQRVGRIEEHLGIPNDDAGHRAGRSTP